MHTSILSVRIFLFSIILFLFSVTKAQAETPSLKISKMEASDTFNELQSFLIKQQYFIQAMDSKQGFVQVKVIPKSKGIFKRAKRHTINFFVIPDGQVDSKISIQINEETLEGNGQVKASSYFYKDEGLLHADHAVYADLIKELEAFYDQL